jgi:alcohol dehydrogenase
MLLASTMAAAAFNSADLGAVHCISEAMGGMYDIHHGLANAMVLTGVMEFNAPAILFKYADVAKALGATDSDAEAAIRRLVEPLNIPTLAQAGIRQEDLPRLAALSAQNISVPSNPRKITEEDFLRLMQQAF